MSNGKASYSLFPFYMSKKNVASFLGVFLPMGKKRSSPFQLFSGK